MGESQAMIEEWRNEGRVEGRAEGMALGMLETRRSDLMRALSLRFQAALPAELSAAVRTIEDLNRLTRWFDAALTAPNLDLFRAVVTAGDVAAARQAGDQ